MKNEKPNIGCLLIGYSFYVILLPITSPKAVKWASKTEATAQRAGGC
jgi:hypothetical protein